MICNIMQSFIPIGPKLWALEGYIHTHTNRQAGTIKRLTRDLGFVSLSKDRDGRKYEIDPKGHSNPGFEPEIFLSHLKSPTLYQLRVCHRKGLNKI